MLASCPASCFTGTTVLRCWMQEVKSGALVHSIQHTGPIWSVSFSKTQIAAGCSDKKVYVYDAVSAALVCAVEHSDEVSSVCFDTIGERLATGSDDHWLRLLQAGPSARLLGSAAAGAVVLSVKLSSGVLSVIFEATRSWVVAGCRDRRVYVVCTKTGDTLHHVTHVRSFLVRGSFHSSVR
jgi:hypothetical protein